MNIQPTNTIGKHIHPSIHRQPTRQPAGNSLSASSILADLSVFFYAGGKERSPWMTFEPDRWGKRHRMVQEDRFFLSGGREQTTDGITARHIHHCQCRGYLSCFLAAPAYITNQQQGIVCASTTSDNAAEPARVDPSRLIPLKCYHQLNTSNYRQEAIRMTTTQLDQSCRLLSYYTSNTFQEASGIYDTKSTSGGNLHLFFSSPHNSFLQGQRN